MRNNLFLGVAAIALIAPAAASAQETTSSIRGTVTSAGTPVAGAQVTITNTAQGSVNTATTGADGNFVASGLLPGGPYSVAVTSSAGNTTVTDINLVVQQPYELPIDIADASNGSGGDIVVTASSINGAGSVGSGLQTVLTQADIRKVASVNRDVRDLERRDPLATMDLSNSKAVSFAGVNPRFNRFTINGVQIGDNFGLNSDANPTARGPVPFDAIGQFSVAVAPVDIRQGNFQGGAIDTVLLSGTNEFHGTGFYSQSTDGLQGKRIGSNRIVLPNYKSETYGATFRGPIIKDKLFFMVSAERNTDPRPLSTTAITQVPGASQATVDQISAIAKNVYNYDTGGFVSINSQKDEKIVGRIDWNIATGQRLSLNYINAYETSTVAQGTSVSPTTPSVGLASDYYQRSVLLRAGIAQLNSDWTDNFSTEARFLYKSNKVSQAPLLGNNFAQFTVCSAPTSVNAGSTNTNTSCGTGVPTVVFGPDISRQANQLFFDTWGGSLQARYTVAGHEIKLLAEVAANRTFNYFLQRVNGAYYFDSIADFQNRNASQFDYANAVSLNSIDAAADFKYQQYTFGAQDTWDVSDRLTLTYGARYDLYAMRTPVAQNDAFFRRYGFYNTKTYKGLGNFQPRISADWKPIDNLRFRFGAAVFGGGSPDIYLSNSYSNTGVLTNRIGTVSRVTPTTGGATATCGSPYTGANAGLCTAALNGVTGTSIPGSINTYLSTATASLQTAPVNALAQDFRLPSVTKLSASVDYKLFGFNVGANYLYTMTNSAVTFTDIRSIQVGTLPDGRPRYNYLPTAGATGVGPGLVNSDTNQDILLTNTGKGYSHIAVVRFDKTYDWGLSFGGSYTRQWIKDVSPASSSTASSNYFNVAMEDPNNATLGTSADQTKWAFKYNLGFDHAFFGDYKTTIQLFGETRAGRPYSFTMQAPITSGRSPVFGVIAGTNLGTNSDQRFLLYVPTSTTDALVTYADSGSGSTLVTAAQTRDSLDAIINSTELKNYRGRIAARNIARNRAFTRIDLHLEQELPTFIGGSRVSIFGDIENLPNLLNHDWGGLRQLGFPQYAPVVQVTCLSAANVPLSGAIGTTTNPAAGCAKYQYSAYRAPNTTQASVTNSLYLIRIGARFTF